MQLAGRCEVELQGSQSMSLLTEQWELCCAPELMELLAMGPAVLQGAQIWAAALQLVPSLAHSGPTGCSLGLLCILPIPWASPAKVLSMEQSSHS